jgi:hypothetical protein
MPDIVKFLRTNYKTLDNLLGSFKSIMVHNSQEEWQKKYNDIVDNFFVHEQKPAELNNYKVSTNPKDAYNYTPNLLANPTGKVTGFWHFDTDTNPQIMNSPEYAEYSKILQGEKNPYLNFYDYLNQKSRSTGVNYLGNFIKTYNVNPTVKDMGSFIGSFPLEKTENEYGSMSARSDMINRFNQRIATQNTAYDKFIREMTADLGSSGQLGKTYANIMTAGAQANKLPFYNYKERYDPSKIFIANGKLIKVNLKNNTTEILGDFGEGMNLNKSQLFPIDDKVYYYNTDNGLTETDIPFNEYQGMLESDKPNYSRGGFSGHGYDVKVPNYFYQDAQNWISYYSKNGTPQTEMNNKIHAWGNYFAQNIPYESALVNWQQAGLDKFVPLNAYYKSK